MNKTIDWQYHTEEVGCGHLRIGTAFVGDKWHAKFSVNRGRKWTREINMNAAFLTQEAAREAARKMGAPALEV